MLIAFNLMLGNLLLLNWHQYITDFSILSSLIIIIIDSKVSK